MTAMDETCSDARRAHAVMRRRLLWGGLAGAAALGGGGLAWWQLTPPAVAGETASLWSLRFPRPQGGELLMQSLRGRPLLVNFWATWCPPCVEELPLLNRFYREQAAAGWQVLGLAVDQPTAVRTFLQKMPLAFPVGLAGLEGAGLARTLGNLSGGLPFSVVFGREGAVLGRKMGRLTSQDLQVWATLK